MWKKTLLSLINRINKLEAILYENKGEAVVFKQFFENIANVQADQKKVGKYLINILFNNY